MTSTPKHWYPKDHKPNGTALLLWPLTGLWRLGGLLRALRMRRYQPQTLTVVIGNITAGGTGKTPLVAALAQGLIQEGRKPVILTRGYGGSIEGPHIVTAEDTSAEIGDEAKWLSQFCQVVVAKDRGAGARWIDQKMMDADLILMDDGMQNPGIAPHLKIAVFNGALGVGNGMIIPSGPLREGMDALGSCDAVAVSGRDDTQLMTIAKKINPDIIQAAITRRLRQDDLNTIQGRPVLAFAGIGDPEQFFTMLRENDVQLVETQIFSDHHPYADKDIDRLRARAKALGANLVTTEKDMMRITDQNGITAIGLEIEIPSSLIDMMTTATV